MFSLWTLQREKLRHRVAEISQRFLEKTTRFVAPQCMAEWVGSAPCGARGRNAPSSPEAGDLEGNLARAEQLCRAVQAGISALVLSCFLQTYKGSVHFLCVSVMRIGMYLTAFVSLA